MYKRILVPLDGSAPAETVVTPAREHSCSESSVVSSLVDGLEAEAQTDPNTMPAGGQGDGTQTFSLIYEISRTKATQLIANALKSYIFTMSTAVPADHAG
jgi:nucleotide-binding universal stress UspA family protein